MLEGKAVVLEHLIIVVSCDAGEHVGERGS